MPGANLDETEGYMKRHSHRLISFKNQPQESVLRRAFFEMFKISSRALNVALHGLRPRYKKLVAVIGTVTKLMQGDLFFLEKLPDLILSLSALKFRV